MERIIFLCLFVMTSLTIAEAQIEVNNLNNVGVQETNAAYKMNIYNDAMNGSLRVESENSGSNIWGIYNLQKGNATNIKYGMFNNLSGFNSSSKAYGLKNQISSPNTRTYGIENYLTSTSTYNYGINNDFRGSGNRDYGVYNYFGGTSSSQAYGMFNSIRHNSPLKVGVKNYIEGKASTDVTRGVDNQLNGNSNRQYGFYNYLSGDREKSYGINASLTGNANYAYGVYSYLANNSNGDPESSKDGVYSVLIAKDSKYNVGVRNFVTDGTNSEQTYGLENHVWVDHGGAGSKSYGTDNYMDVDQAVTQGEVYGVKSRIAGTGSPTKVYGVYSTIDQGINATGDSYAGYFIGGLYLDGTPLTGSDERLKEEVKEVKSELEKLKKLKPKSYKLKSEKQRNKKEDKLSYGFLAHEFQKIYPELVTEVARPGKTRKVITKKEEVIKDDEGNEITIPEEFLMVQDMDGEPMLAMDYNSIIALLVSSLQEQQAQIETIQGTLDDCGCGGTRGKSNGLIKDDTGFNQTVTPIMLANKLSVKIYPNPTDNDATLEINSEESGVHQIHVYDKQGRLVHKEEIYVSSGTHQHEIESRNWPGGLYYVNTTYQGISKSLKLIVAGK